MGKQYCTMWTTPVNVPVINLETEYGGLTPIRKRRGMSSNSLRLQTENGHQFNMRSVVKDYSKLLLLSFRNLKLLSIAADMNSSSHPFGALIVAELSKAVNIYYVQNC